MCSKGQEFNRWVLIWLSIYQRKGGDQKQSTGDCHAYMKILG